MSGADSSVNLIPAQWCLYASHSGKPPCDQHGCTVDEERGVVDRVRVGRSRPVALTSLHAEGRDHVGGCGVTGTSTVLSL